MTHWSGRTPSASFVTNSLLEDASRSPAGETGDKQPQEGPDFVRIQQSPEFAELRSGLRRFVFPVSLLFFLWYLGYVVLAAYATDFMSHRVLGSINVGLLLGLSQFVTTLLITLWYRRFARRRIDPKVAALVRSS
jgi:uncharacterized membrane protein (DUF485 family)